MDGDPVELTAEQQHYILGLVRSGTFPHVAVETAGLLWADYRRWQTQEQRQGRGKQIRAFRTALRQAEAQSRAKAELEVREKSPLLWLKHGPGRDRPGYPGWANPAKPSVGPKKGSASGALESPIVQTLLERILDAMHRHPEARMDVAAAIDRAGAQGRYPGR